MLRLRRILRIPGFLIFIALATGTPSVAQVVYCHGVRYWGACPDETPTCRPGWVVMADGEHCMPAGSVGCGNGYCGPGLTCGSGNHCLSATDSDCGNGSHCSNGEKCGIGNYCVAAGYTDCGNFHVCGPATKCSADGAGRCIGTALTATPKEYLIGSLGYGGFERRLKTLANELTSGQRVKQKPTNGGKVWNPYTGKWEGERVWNPYSGKWEFVRAVKENLSAQELLAVLKDAVEIVGLPWYASDAIAADHQREIAVNRTKDLLQSYEEQVLNAVISKMTADTQKLTPFEWDTPASLAEKRAVARQLELQLRNISDQARREIHSPTAFVVTENRNSTVRFEYKPGPALRQLETIRRTGSLWD